MLEPKISQNLPQLSQLSKPLNKWSILPWSVLIFVALVFTCTQSRSKVVAVGKVTLTIGQAVVVSGNGSSALAHSGLSVYQGDRVETAEGGHVHIRFIDGAMVSVRPSSRLVVENYEFDAERPSQSTVVFRLDHGATRAVSGAAAQAARERFRLNTPLVAIGVKGTDFLVRTQGDQTLALVNQGAIVVTPFGLNCSPNSFGVCNSSATRYLSAEMGNMYVEYKNITGKIDIKANTNALLFAPPIIVTSSNNSSTNSSSSTPNDAPKPGAEALGTSGVMLSQDAVRTDGNANSTIQRLNQAPPSPDQLVWGRWSELPANASDFSELRQVARVGRSVTVGNDNFLLYRIEPKSVELSTTLGKVGFNLQRSFAQLITPTATLPASVNGGTLTLNFTERQYATMLNLNSLPTGAVQLSASGFVRSDGMFATQSAQQVVAGAVALDGKSVGYLFEKVVPAGTLSGTTLWGK